MKFVSDLIETLWETGMKKNDLPVNVLVDGKLCDIKDFYYDSSICEYVMELTEGYEYEKK